MAANRQAWLVAGSAFSATLLGLVLLPGQGNEGRESSEPLVPVEQPASPAPERDPAKTERSRPDRPASPSLSPQEAVDRLVAAWVEDDWAAAHEVAARVAVRNFFQEPLQYRPDFYLSDCRRHSGDWSCSLSYELDDRVGYSLAIEQRGQRYWVAFADLIVL